MVTLNGIRSNLVTMNEGNVGAVFELTPGGMISPVRAIDGAWRRALDDLPEIAKITRRPRLQLRTIWKASGELRPR